MDTCIFLHVCIHPLFANSRSQGLLNRSSRNFYKESASWILLWVDDLRSVQPFSDAHFCVEDSGGPRKDLLRITNLFGQILCSFDTIQPSSFIFAKTVSCLWKTVLYLSYWFILASTALRHTSCLGPLIFAPTALDPLHFRPLVPNFPTRNKLSRWADCNGFKFCKGGPQTKPHKHDRWQQKIYCTTLFAWSYV